MCTDLNIFLAIIQCLAYATIGYGLLVYVRVPKIFDPDYDAARSLIITKRQLILFSIGGCIFSLLAVYDFVKFFMIAVYGTYWCQI